MSDRYTTLIGVNQIAGMSVALKTFLFLAIIFSMILVISSEAPATNDSSMAHDSVEVEEGKGYHDDDGYYKGGHEGYDDDDTAAKVNVVTPTEDAGAAAVL
ncbi:hypothetical protein Tco_0876876 [Tanacetum coccineum]|uniref:Uncharacterized protein n=1 Tax=Tanacetum coccineum TaxID=301880 RepID=A0ABQ5BTJ1_9ASTR